MTCWPELSSISARALMGKPRKHCGHVTRTYFSCFLWLRVASWSYRSWLHQSCLHVSMYQYHHHAHISILMLSLFDWRHDQRDFSVGNTRCYQHQKSKAGSNSYETKQPSSSPLSMLPSMILLAIVAHRRYLHHDPLPYLFFPVVENFHTCERVCRHCFQNHRHHQRHRRRQRQQQQ